MILQEAVDRRIYKCEQDGIVYYSDIPLGVYVIRGDSMVLLGGVAADDNNMSISNMKQIDLEKLLGLQEQDEKKKKKEKGNEQQTADGEPLTWDFDTDLIA